MDIPKLTDKPAGEFLMGFEIECLVHRDSIGELERLMNHLFRNGITIEHDGSIRGANDNLIAREYTTPPLPHREAIRQFEQLLVELRRLQRDGRFVVNNSCGFHVNLSEKNIFNSSKHNLSYKFGYLFIQNFGVKKWLANFNRMGNRYCTWERKPTLEKLIDEKKQIGNGVDNDDTQYHAHYSAVNFEKFTPRYNNNQKRIEIRVAGGQNYINEELINRFLLDIRRAIRKAWDEI